MELYLHFGIYKAGSSYLQYVLANQRSYLIEQQVYFPHSLNDRKMLAGEISPGNADGLEEALKKPNEAGCIRIFKNWLEKGKKVNCTKILISAEALVHQIAIPQTLKLMESSARKAGFSKIHALGFFRDLADHAISTYKHRGKSGQIPDFQHWLKNVYETPALLRNLYEVRVGKEFQIIWTFRKFKKDSSFMEKAFFEWLSIPPPNFHAKPHVNESVTLSEVFIMNEVRKTFPLVTDYFVRGFKSLPTDKKAKDLPLQNYFHDAAITILNRYEDILNLMNGFMMEEEKLIIGKWMDEQKTDKMSLMLSDEQLEILFDKIRWFQSNGKLVIFRRKFARFLPKGTAVAVMKIRQVKQKLFRQ